VLLSPQFISIPRLRGNYTSPQPRDVEEVKDADGDTLLSFRLAAANPTLQMSRWPGESPGALEGGGGGSRAILRGRRGEDVGHTVVGLRSRTSPRRIWG